VWLLRTALDAPGRQTVVAQRSADCGGRLWTTRVDLRIRRLVESLRACCAKPLREQGFAARRCGRQLELILGEMGG